MKLAAIIQARMGSVRLPGKTMMEINGKPILAHVIERAKAAVPDVFIATPPDSWEIIEFAGDNHIPLSFDRYPRNVLDSYYNCATNYEIENIVRITADNPLIRPETIKKVIDFYFQGGYDWAANCRLKITFPIGDDAEVFSYKTLKKAWWASSDNWEQECVTGYIYRHPERFKLGVLENEIDQSGERWTVDTKEDLERVRALAR